MALGFLHISERNTVFDEAAKCYFLKEPINCEIIDLANDSVKFKTIKPLFIDFPKIKIYDVGNSVFVESEGSVCLIPDYIEYDGISYNGTFKTSISGTETDVTFSFELSVEDGKPYSVIAFSIE